MPRAKVSRTSRRSTLSRANIVEDDYEAKIVNKNYMMMSGREALRLKSLKVLAKVWGYRAGARKSHKAYEAESHGDMRLVQYYSDVVFRNIEQQQREVFDSDVLDTLGGVKYLGKSQFKKEIQELVATYLSEPSVKSKFKKLIETNLNGASPAFASIVIGARCLYYIGQGDFFTAFNVALTFMKTFRAGLKAFDRKHNPKTKVSLTKASDPELLAFMDQVRNEEDDVYSDY